MKFRNSYLTILAFLTLFISIQSVAQRFDSTLKRLDKDYPQEKLYLHFDKEAYFPGETIWFKAYLFAGNDLSLISKTLYAELIDDKGKVLQRKTAPLFESTGAAAFDIPAELHTQQLYVRAYTKWMLNFDTSYLFVKRFSLLTRKTISPKVNTAPEQMMLQFFPEGGNLVEGLTSKIAFKANDSKGRPVNLSADIVGREGKKILTIKSIHDGMGQFSLLPDPGETYKAIWKDASGVQHETLLPQAQKHGLVLSAVNKGQKIIFSVHRSADTLSQYNKVYIVAQAQQQMLYRATADLTKGPLLNGMLPISDIPASIIQLTVFDANQRPIAERILFVNQQDYYFITDLNGAEINMNKRKKNVLQIDVPDSLRCNLSVSVTDADLTPVNANSVNIYSHLLLTSDIKGYVHNPGYYFSSDADSVASHLDLVMLTNGWRRFNWNEVLESRYPVIKFKPDNYLAIEGNVYGIPKTSLSHKELTGILEFKNKNKEFLNTEVKQDGTFTIPGMIFYDTAKVFYQFNNDKNKTLTSRATFEVKNNLLPFRSFIKGNEKWLMGINKNEQADLQISKESSERYFSELEKQQKVQILSEVVVKGRQKSKKQTMEEEYTSGFFKGGDDITFITEDDPAASSSMTIFNYLQGRVAGLSISTAGTQSSLSWRGAKPTLFLNEIEQDIETIQNVPMSDVAMVKVFRPPFFGAMGGGTGGAVAVYLKKGKSVNQTTKGLDVSLIEGYSPVREFYSPDYSKTDQSNDQVDYRATLYWNPFVLTSKEHRKILLTFYNNDSTKKIRVIIEGCNQEGRLTRIEKVFR